jgi:type VI secretion system protein ImpE
LADSGRFPALATDLAGELKGLQVEVRAHPEDAKLRAYLFQLLAVQGEWQRALNQLQVCAQLSIEAIPMAQTYREAIRCEVFRGEVFAGKRAPHILGEPPAWIGPLIEALNKLTSGQVPAAEALRAQAFEQAPATGGAIDGQPFAWIADADSRLGPVCEAIIAGKYYWIPFERLASVKVEAPSDLRDVVWASAYLRFVTGATQVALLPARYPETERSEDDALRLSRMTTWRELGEDTYAGIGQRMWATDTGEYPLLDTREIALGAEA